MKEKAVTDIFETALVLINNATDTFQHGSQPEASLPTTQSLYRCAVVHAQVSALGISYAETWSILQTAPMWDSFGWKVVPIKYSSLKNYENL